MQLVDYRRRENLTQAQFAARCALLAGPVLGRTFPVPQQMIARAERGTRPSRDLMALIFAASRGGVTPSDFYWLPDLAQLALDAGGDGQAVARDDCECRDSEPPR